MAANLRFFVFAICIFSCISAPVPYAESLRKLEELKGKLVELEATLKDFNNEVNRGLSPEDQAILDKHKSLQNVIQSALSKGTHTDADEDAAVPDAAEERRDAAHLYRDLSPEDQAILDKHKSLQNVIQSALSKGSHTDEDEDAAVLDADERDVEAERRDAAHIYRDLSAADQALINKYQSLKPAIKAALSKAGHTDAEEDPEIEDAETVKRRGMSNVFTYMSQLSSEDQALLRRMRSKVPNLQLALDKKSKRNLQVEEAAHESAEVQTVLRRGNANVFTYMSQLSDSDQQLLKRMRSKVPYLQLALDKKHSRNNQANKRSEDEDESMISDSKEDDKLSQFEQTLSPEDLALLKAMKSKLHFLKEALHAQKPSAGEEESASESEGEDVPEDGPMEDRREAKMDGWNEQPLTDVDLGKEETDLQERCPCQKHKEGSEKRCACDKELEARCPKCHDHDAIVRLLAERCPSCHKDKTPDAVVEEVETRLMNDLDFAQASGISMNELIEKIKAKAAKRVLKEEEELQMLAA